MDPFGFSGFNFSNSFRNESLLKKHNFMCPKMLKTGTTITGLIFEDGIVLGADTRATEGPIVADKNCKKIHYVSPNIYCCGAGTAADTEQITSLVSGELSLLRYESNKPSRVIAACTILKRRLFRHMGYISAALVLGGVDSTGPHLFMIYPHGSSSKLPYVTMGSGSLAAMSVFESEYKNNLKEEEAINLVHKAIKAGIYNDLGSGSNCDICIIRKKSVRYIRGFDTSNQRKQRRQYIIKKGTTNVIAEKINIFKKNIIIEDLMKDEEKEKEKEEKIIEEEIEGEKMEDD